MTLRNEIFEGVAIYNALQKKPVDKYYDAILAEQEKDRKDREAAKQGGIADAQKNRTATASPPIAPPPPVVTTGTPTPNYGGWPQQPALRRGGMAFNPTAPKYDDGGYVGVGREQESDTDRLVLQLLNEHINRQIGEPNEPNLPADSDWFTQGQRDRANTARDTPRQGGPAGQAMQTASPAEAQHGYVAGAIPKIDDARPSAPPPFQRGAPSPSRPPQIAGPIPRFEQAMPPPTPRAPPPASVASPDARQRWLTEHTAAMNRPNQPGSATTPEPPPIERPTDGEPTFAVSRSPGEPTFARTEKPTTDLLPDPSYETGVSMPGFVKRALAGDRFGLPEAPYGLDISAPDWLKRALEGDRFGIPRGLGLDEPGGGQPSPPRGEPTFATTRRPAQSTADALGGAGGSEGPGLPPPAAPSSSTFASYPPSDARTSKAGRFVTELERQHELERGIIDKDRERRRVEPGVFDPTTEAERAAVPGKLKTIDAETEKLKKELMSPSQAVPPGSLAVPPRPSTTSPSPTSPPSSSSSSSPRALDPTAPTMRTPKLPAGRSTAFANDRLPDYDKSRWLPPVSPGYAPDARGNPQLRFDPSTKETINTPLPGTGMNTPGGHPNQATPPVGAGTGVGGGGSNTPTTAPKPAAGTRLPLGDQRREQAYDPVADRADKDNKFPVDDTGRSLAPEQSQRLMAAAHQTIQALHGPGQQPVGQGAVSPPIYRQFVNANNPTGELTKGEAALAGMWGIYKYLLTEGRVKEAGMMAMGLMQAASVEAAVSGRMAYDQVMGGDQAGANQSVVNGLSSIPDGKRHVLGPDGKTIVTTDAGSNANPYVTRLDPQTTLAIALGLGNGSGIWKALQGSVAAMTALTTKPDLNATGRALSDEIKRNQIEYQRRKLGNMGQVRRPAGGTLPDQITEIVRRLRSGDSQAAAAPAVTVTMERGQGDDSGMAYRGGSEYAEREGDNG